MSGNQIPARILIVDDESGIREFLSICLESEGYDVTAVQSGAEALRKLSQRSCGFDIVLTDLTMSGIDGLEVLRHASNCDPKPQLIMMTAYGTTHTAVTAMKNGAFDYLTKPFKSEEVILTVAKALEETALRRENVRLRSELAKTGKLDRLLGRSPAMLKIFDIIQRIAPTPTNVLIRGESGTGKELVASALHKLSDRAHCPWVAVNCAAIPTPLLESELFGHRRGAFTGAVSDRKGMFEHAGDGTIFLDEIGEIDQAMQAKLLRVLQERRVRPVGATDEIPVNCRIVSATNRDLERAMETGEFRNDLYFRLNVISIHLPALRHRQEDIGLLIEHFFHSACERLRKPLQGLTPDAWQRFLAYSYPGNIRELANLVERAVALEASSWLGPEHIPCVESDHPELPANDPHPSTPQARLALDDVLADVERKLIVRALDQTKHVRKEAAANLGITLRSLRYRLEKLGLESDPEWSKSDDASDADSKVTLPK